MTEIDKTSTAYFMSQMTQKEFEELCKFRFANHDFETGWNRNDRYILNKIRHDYLEKMNQEEK